MLGKHVSSRIDKDTKKSPYGVLGKERQARDFGDCTPWSGWAVTSNQFLVGGTHTPYGTESVPVLEPVL